MMASATRSAPEGEKGQSNGMPEYQFHGGDIRVLVIDDDPAIGRLIQTVLVNPQITIDTVAESDKVRGSLEAHQYHVILMDYVIPDLEATTILSWIKELQSDASVIVVTAFPSMDSALTCLRSHTFDYVPKPFRLDDMKKTLMRCLESRGLLRLSEEALREQIGSSIRERRKAASALDAVGPGEADGRVAGLSVADRARQELGVDRDLVPDCAGPADSRRRPVPGGAIAAVIATRHAASATSRSPSRLRRRSSPSGFVEKV